MTLIVNCRFMLQDLTGVQRFAEEITRRLVTTHPGDVILVAPRGTLRSNNIAGKPIQQIGTLKGHLWEQVELATFAHKNKGFLINLCNTGPIFWRRQLIVIHDLTWKRFPDSYSFLFRAFYAFATALIVKRAASIATVSEYSRTELAHEYAIPEDRIGVVPNSVDIQVEESAGCRPLVPLPEEFFLVVSSLNRHKNITRFVDAFRTYTERSGTGTKLVLVGGSSPTFAKVRVVDQENDDPSKSAIFALGRVTDEELIWLYRHAKAFFFPSLYEGFGLPPLEAASYGCPVFSSNAASLPEVLGASASYFDPNSIESMTLALEAADSNPYDADRASVRPTIPSWTWDDSCVRLLSFIPIGESGCIR